MIIRGRLLTEFFRKKVEIPHVLQLDLHSEEGLPYAKELKKLKADG
jgi:hypothetical protein